MNAKAGDAINPKAQNKASLVIAGQTQVAAKTDGQGGVWICITCGERPQNNMGASTHEKSKPTHKLAWYNSESMRVEES